jgi:HD-GYP domain-containing protein (c-di-GMP phosphodiesterase class II)
LGHSPAVAALAESAGRVMELDADECRRLYYAGLLHDLGVVAISTGILEKPHALSTMEQEKVRLHPYYTARALSLAQLGSLARIAGGHHERADSSGYPAGIPGNALPLATRLLAAADVYRALTERRAHREPFTPPAAERVMHDEVAAGRLDRVAVAAVLRAAGHAPARGREIPHALTGREIVVLRSVAVGRGDKEIAAQLGISPRTVHHHVERIYRKIGVASRAAAALYAIEHGLLPLA